MEQLNSVHDQTDPKVQAILAREQYEQWRAIREKELQHAVEKKKG
jgi:hypothetical protein